MADKYRIRWILHWIGNMAKRQSSKCLRCGKDFRDPVPEIVNPGGNVEIATADWCAACNKAAMAALGRQRSAYWEQGGRPPWQNEKLEAKVIQKTQPLVAGVCPDCKATLWFEEGCVLCHSCGYSRC